MLEIKLLSGNMEIVRPEDYESFVVTLFSWYDRQVDPDNRFVKAGLPNIFDLFESPDYYGSMVISQMIESAVNQLEAEENISSSAARRKVIYAYDESRSLWTKGDFANSCTRDVARTLDLYHLSYQYTESEHHQEFFNVPVVEVW